MAQSVLFDYKQRYGVLPSSPRQLLAFSRGNKYTKSITYVQAKSILETTKNKLQSRPKPPTPPGTKRKSANTPPVLQNSVSMNMAQNKLNRRKNKYKKHQLKHSQTKINTANVFQCEDSKTSTEETKEVQKQKRLRKRVVEELVSTEKTYLSGLEKLFKFYINPFKNSKDKKIRKLLTSADHSILFPSDLSTIYALHIQLNADLIKYTDKWNNQTSKVGHIFIKYGHLFKMYQDYFHKHEKAVQHLMKLEKKNSKFAKWSMEQSNKISGLTIQSLLILPIQRLPRYEMLLKEIIKRTVQYHVDLYDLQEASEQITEVTELINDKMKEHDRRIKVTMVEKRFVDLVDAIGHFVIPARIFIAESSENPSNENYIVRHDKFGNQIAITMFLFNDCLIYGYYANNRAVANNDKTNKTNKTPQKKGKLRFGSILVFDPLFAIEDVPFNDDYNYQKISCLKLTARHHAMWISFHSYDAKLKWFEMINEQNNILVLQNLNARRRSATKSIPRTPQDNNKNEHRDDLYLPIPVFVPDDYSDICMDCKAKFSVFTRRHHCYFCGKLCCDKCTKYKLIDIWKLYFEKKKEYVRVCEMCKVEREEYLNAKQNKYMYYSNTPSPNNDRNDANGNRVLYENGSDPQLISQTTFDITKSYQMQSRRVSQRRVKMGKHHKQKSLENANNI